MTGIDPLSMIGLAFTAVQAIGQFSQARSQASALEYNASIDEANATQARMQAAEEETRTRRDNMLRLGANAARRGASGVAYEGSPVDVQADAAAEGELRALDARYGGLMESRYYQTRAEQTRREAKATRTGGAFGALGTLVGGGFGYGRSLLGGGGGGTSRSGYTAGVRGGYGRLVGGV